MKMQIQGSTQKRATGPRTPWGKAIASRNALKNGLFTRDVVLSKDPFCESQVEFDRLRETYMEDLKPAGVMEQSLVEMAVVLLWRWMRFLRAERAAASKNYTFLEGNLAAAADLEAMENPELPERERRNAEARWREHSQMSVALAGIPPSDSLERLAKYESHFLCQWRQTLLELGRLQRLRLAAEDFSWQSESVKAE